MSPPGEFRVHMHTYPFHRLRRVNNHIVECNAVLLEIALAISDIHKSDFIEGVSFNSRVDSGAISWWALPAPDRH